MVQPPADVVTPPPLAPTSGVGADTAGCLTGAAELGVDVAGLSLPVCPLIATMILLLQSNFAKSLKLRDCRGFASPTSGSFQSHFESLLLTGFRLENPGRAPKACVLWRAVSLACVRVCQVAIWCVGGSGLEKLSWGFLLWLVALAPDALVSWLVIFWTASVEPVFYGFPYYKSLLQRRFGSTVGAAIPLSYSSVAGLPTDSLSSIYLLPLSP